MRTTVTLDNDVASKLKALAHRRQVSFKEAINEVLRRGLAAQETRSALPPLKMLIHHGTLAPGIDEGRLNQLVDELEIAEVVRKLRLQQ